MGSTKAPNPMKSTNNSLGRTLNKTQKMERRLKAYDMRLRGKTYADIARELEIGLETARRWVTAHMQDIELPIVDDVRKMEVDRMLRYLDRLDTRIDEGDDKAIGIAIRVSERLCRMLGADMPQQTEVQVTEVTQVDLAVQELIREQTMRNDRIRAQAAIDRVTGSDGVSD